MGAYLNEYMNIINMRALRNVRSVVLPQVYVPMIEEYRAFDGKTDGLSLDEVLDGLPRKRVIRCACGDQSPHR